jgi:transposase
MSPAFKSAMELLITVCQMLLSRFIRKNSKNSSLPPAMGPGREKSSHAKKKRKPGGQLGHEGNTLQLVDNPEEIKKIRIDRKTLPGRKWKDAGYERRQVFDLVIRRHVTEYRAGERGDGRNGSFA